MDAPPSLHPTDQTLRSFGLGKLDDRMAEAVVGHLEGCADCRGRVAGLSADSFLDRVRGAGKSSGEFTSARSQPGPTSVGKGTNPPPPAETLPPGLADHPDYEIKRELGRGGMGVVYLAHNTMMGRDEVLKVMGRHLMERPGVLERFQREVRSVARLRHPNVVTAYTAFRLDGGLVFAMEYVEGLDLSRLIKTKGPLPVPHAAFFTHQAALGLQHAHEKGTVHRDIKPHNLMATHDGKARLIKVLDFGLAKATREEKLDKGLTTEGQALGTPDYIAPEQILNAPDVDIRADLYSLGATLYFLLTGRPPFRANSLYDIYQAHISRDADPLNLVRPEVPAELAALVAKLMAKDPDRRFQTPAEVADALKPFFRPAAARAGAETSQTGQSRATDVPVTPSSSAPGPDSCATGTVVTRPARPAEPAADGQWANLIDVREPEHATAPAPEPAPPSRRPPWVWPSVAAAVLVTGLTAAWLAGVFKVKTADGVIVMENLPDDAEVFVDGARVQVRWPGGGGPAEVESSPGTHGVNVRKDGFEASGEVVALRSGGREAIKLRLVPLAPPPKALSAADSGPSVAAGPEPGASGGPIGAAGVDARAGATPSPPEPKVGDWKTLFDGEGFTGWNALSDRWVPLKDPRPGWDVLAGVIVHDPSQTSNLVTHETFRDFMLSLEYQVPVGAKVTVASSGVGFATKDGENYSVLECDITPGKSGTLLSVAHATFGSKIKNPQGLEVVPAEKGVERPQGEWNELTVRCDGRRITVSLNGKVVNRAESDHPIFTGIGLQGADMAVNFRNIRVTTSATAGPSAADARPAPVGASAPPAPPANVTVAGGRWEVRNGELVQADARAKHPFLQFGDEGWTDYDFSADFMRLEGPSDVSLVFRSKGPDDNMRFAVSAMGGWKYAIIEANEPGGSHRWLKSDEYPIVSRKWYTARVRVRGELSVGTLADAGRVLAEVEASDAKHPRGGVGFRTWQSSYQFRNIRVTGADGNVLWTGLPAVGSAVGSVLPATEAPARGSGAAEAAGTPATAPAPKQSRVERSDSQSAKSLFSGMEFVRIRAGTFLCGSPDSDKSAAPHEKPPHLVHITRPFYLGKYEVTQKQYLKVAGKNRSVFNSDPENPADAVNWLSAVQFCNLLSEKDGLTPFYTIEGEAVSVPDWGRGSYRLPTSAEWEYACRAGSTTVFFCDRTGELMDEYAWFNSNSGDATHPVGRLRPNAWGLYDMQGNVAEWCWDFFDPAYYKPEVSTDPKGPEAGARRVIRGAAYGTWVRGARSAATFPEAPTYFHRRIGFRVARSGGEK